VDVVTLHARHQRESPDGHPGSHEASSPMGARVRSRAARRLERMQESAFIAMAAASSYVRSDVELTEFFRRLGKTVAGLVGARRVAFWRLGQQGTLALQPEPYGFGRDSAIRSIKFDLAAEGGAGERAFFADELGLNEGTSAELDRLSRENGLTEIRNSIAVPWRIGERRIGSLAAYDSRRGFTADDLWTLRLVAMAAGLVWQYREAEEELDSTVERLQVAVEARRRLLDNVAAGGDHARRRFATALHDDSLQLLTAAELQLERIQRAMNGTGPADQLEQLRETLQKVEGSLRNLLIDVGPAAMDLRINLTEAIRERLESLRLNTGIEPDVDLRLGGSLAADVESIVFKNVAEALTNVEKHAHATRIRISAVEIDGGVGVEVVDDGTGFVVAEARYVPGHLGLIAMRERAQLAGGWCRIQSEPGAGARVEFWIPCAQ
jgi:signal transduction histidine kinase